MTLRGGGATARRGGARLWQSFPGVLAAGLLGVALGRVELPLGLGLLALAVALVPGRLALTGLAELAATASVALLAFPLAAFAEPAPGRLGGIVAAVALPGAIGLLLVASARRLLAAPRGGDGATLALPLFAALLAGAGRTGWLYPALVAAVGAATLAALRALDPARRGAAPTLRGIAGAGLVGLAALGGVVAAGAGLPVAYREVGGAAVAWLEPPVQVGFTGGAVRLGALRDVWQSPAEVARIEGVASGALLRGATFQRYERGLWLPGERSFGGGPVAGPADGRLERLADGALPLLLPAGAAPVDGAPGARRDERGSWELSAAARWEVVSFRSGGAPQLPPAVPAELIVPAELHEALRALAASLAGEAPGGRRRAEALVSALETRYVYALEVPPPGKLDPALAFLTTTRRGHCELFATALVLLLRVEGIPARLVTGYRATEQLPLGGLLVRERNAHAWVEAYLDGAWETLDPSPVEALDALQPTRAPLSAALLALVGGAARGAGRFLAERTPLQWSLLAAALALTLVVLQRWRRRASPAALDPLAPDAPSALAAALFSRLATSGLPRGRAEPLERYAERVAERAPREATLLHELAALRYGGVGDAKSWERRARALLGTGADGALSE